MMPPLRPEHRFSQTESTDGSGAEESPVLQQQHHHDVNDDANEDANDDGKHDVESAAPRSSRSSSRRPDASPSETSTSHRPQHRHRSSKSHDGKSGRRGSNSKSGNNKDQTENRLLPFPEAYNEIENLNQIPFWLTPCHFVAAIFQFMQAIFLFAFSAKVDLQWCVYTFYPTSPELVVGDYETDIYAVPQQHEMGCYSITWYAGVAIVLAGLDHMCSILPCFRPTYHYHIERHQSPFRWIEYSLSCPLMRVHIAQVAGVTDVYTLVLTFFLCQAVILFGLLHERLNAKNRADGYVQDYSAFMMGSFANVASWAVIFAYFIQGMGKIDQPLALTLVVALFVLELTFPVVFVLQWAKIGIFKDYLVGEFAFCVLSFTTKTFLAWATLIGANAYARKA